MNKISPLFAIEVDSLFSEGRIDEAYSLCSAGIEAFPEYSTAYALQSRILDAMGQVEESIDIVKLGLERSRTSKILRKIAEEKNISTKGFQRKTQDNLQQNDNMLEVDKAADINEVKAPIDIHTTHNVSKQDEIQTADISIDLQLRRLETAWNANLYSLKWKANDISLIAGLEVHNTRPIKTFRHIPMDFPEFPPFPDIRKKRNTASNAIEQLAVEISERKMFTPLEELAQRLERARIPVIHDDSTLTENINVPEFVTDTMAEIYEKQGAYEQALKAYQILAGNKPDKLQIYKPKIIALTAKINAQ